MSARHFRTGWGGMSALIDISKHKLTVAELKYGRPSKELNCKSNDYVIGYNTYTKRSKQQAHEAG